MFRLLSRFLSSVPAKGRHNSSPIRNARRHRFLCVEALEERTLLSGSGIGGSAALEAYGQVPLSFEANQGQAGPGINFVSHGNGYGLMLSPGEAALSLRQGSAGGNLLLMSVVGANRLAPAVGVDELPAKSNYFIGNDPRRWQTNVPNYEKVAYANIYPSINLVYYGDQRQLEYDFQVNPGANPGVIRLAFQGTQKISLDAGGDLVLHATGGDVIEHAPVLYQQIGGVRRAVSGHYVLQADGQVGFAVGAYNVHRPLVIDPVLSYSSYLGGLGVDSAGAIAVDGSGDLYVVGTTSATNFPTLNALQGTNAGGNDAFVTELSPNGTGFVFSTYLGGSGNESGNGIALDASGNIYLAGTTTSANFPTKNPLQAALGGGSDAFVTKLSPGGASLVYSTYLGGSGNESTTAAGITGSAFESSQAIGVDSQGDAYVTGSTTSTNFPTVNAFQSVNAGGNDGFVSELNAAGSALVYSTYLGGSGDDFPAAIAVDSNGNAYVAGATKSTNFPTVNALQATLGGTEDAFVAELRAGGAALVYSTYLGGSNTDYAYGLAVDAAGAAYVTGATRSADFPTVNAFQGTYTAHAQVVFVSKLSPGGTSLAYSTYLNSGIGDGEAIAVDSAGDAFVTGHTTSGFPLMNAVQAINAGGADGFIPYGDAFVAELNPAGSGLIFSTYLGGSGSDMGTAIAVDAVGNAYVAGWTESTNFPVQNAFQPSSGGGRDAFVARFSFGPSFLITTPTTATAGGAFSITVTAVDASNNLNPNYVGTVHFTSSDLFAVLPADYTFTSADQGVHSFSVTLEKAGAQTITATDTTTSTISGSSSVAVTAAAASSLTATGFPSSTTAGNAGTISVTAFDAYGNTATGYTGTVHFASSDGKAVLPADYTFTTADAGSHTFSVTLKTAGMQSISATDTATSSMTTTQAGITVNPAAASLLVVTGPSNATVGVAFSITVTLYDAYGNVATGYTGTVHFKSSDGKASLPSNYTFKASDRGTHTFSGMVLKTKGKQSITATDTLFSTITGSLNLNVT